MRYRLKLGAPKHYLNGRFYAAGEEVPLPPGVRPGRWFEPVATDAAQGAEQNVGAAEPAPRSRGRRAADLGVF